MSLSFLFCQIKLTPPLTPQDYCGFPGGAAVKNPPANAGDEGSTLGLGRSPGEGNGNPLQHSCLGNAVDRGTWWAIVHGVANEFDTVYQLNNNILFPTHTHLLYPPNCQ